MISNLTPIPYECSLNGKIELKEKTIHWQGRKISVWECLKQFFQYLKEFLLHIFAKIAAFFKFLFRLEESPCIGPFIEKTPLTLEQLEQRKVSWQASLAQKGQNYFFDTIAKELQTTEANNRPAIILNLLEWMLSLKMDRQGCTEDLLFSNKTYQFLISQASQLDAASFMTFIDSLKCLSNKLETFYISSFAIYVYYDLVSKKDILTPEAVLHWHYLFQDQTLNLQFKEIACFSYLHEFNKKLDIEKNFSEEKFLELSDKLVSLTPVNFHNTLISNQLLAIAYKLKGSELISYLSLIEQLPSTQLSHNFLKSSIIDFTLQNLMAKQDSLLPNDLAILAPLFEQSNRQDIFHEIYAYTFLNQFQKEILDTNNFKPNTLRILLENITPLLSNFAMTAQNGTYLTLQKNIFQAFARISEISYAKRNIDAHEIKKLYDPLAAIFGLPPQQVYYRDDIDEIFPKIVSINELFENGYIEFAIANLISLEKEIDDKQLKSDDVAAGFIGLWENLSTPPIHVKNCTSYLEYIWKAVDAQGMNP